MEALNELFPLPFEILDGELFRHLDDLARFSFRMTCRKFFSKLSPDENDSIVFLDAMLLCCRYGYVEQLRYWFPGDDRPNLQLVDYCEVAALYGQVSVLEWVGPALKYFSQGSNFIMHAIMSDDLATIRFLLDRKFTFVGLDVKVAQARGVNAEIISLLNSYLPEKKLSSFKLFDTSMDLLKIYASKPNEAREIDEINLTPLLVFPRTHILEFLLEQRSILFTNEAIVSLVKRGLWKLVKSIFLLQNIPTFADALPPTPSAFGFPEYRSSIYSAIGVHASKATDPSILVWFLNHGYVDSSSLSIVPLLKGKNAHRYVLQVLKTASRRTLSLIIRDLIYHGDEELIKRMADTDLFSNWTRSDTLAIKKRGMEDLLEWLALEKKAVDVKNDEIFGSLFQFGLSDVFMKVFPAIRKNFIVTEDLLMSVKEVATGKVSDHGHFDLLPYALRNGAILEHDARTFLANCPASVYISLLEEGLIKWKETTAEVLVYLGRCDLLQVLRDGGYPLYKELMTAAINSRNPAEIIPTLVVTGIAEWTPELSLMAVRSRKLSVFPDALTWAGHSSDELDSLLIALISDVFEGSIIATRRVVDWICSKTTHSFHNLGPNLDALFSSSVTSVYLHIYSFITLLRHGLKLDMARFMRILFSRISIVSDEDRNEMIVSEFLPRLDGSVLITSFYNGQERLEVRVDDIEDDSRDQISNLIASYSHRSPFISSSLLASFPSSSFLPETSPSMPKPSFEFPPSSSPTSSALKLRQDSSETKVSLVSDLSSSHGGEKEKPKKPEDIEAKKRLEDQIKRIRSIKALRDPKDLQKRQFTVHVSESNGNQAAATQLLPTEEAAPDDLSLSSIDFSSLKFESVDDDSDA